MENKPVLGALIFIEAFLFLIIGLALHFNLLALFAGVGGLIIGTFFGWVFRGFSEH